MCLSGLDSVHFSKSALFVSKYSEESGKGLFIQYSEESGFTEQAMKQVLGIKNETACMKVTPPLAVASLVHGDDMRWNPNDNFCY